MSEKSSSEMSDVDVNNVYDFAYSIAQEFEKIVHLYGIDEIKPVVDKVINVLEILEASVKRIESLESELCELKSRNLHLRSEKISCENERSKLKQIYEESEELWLAEIGNLKAQLSALKSENDLLRSSLATKVENCTTSDSDDTLKKIIQDQENVILRLKNITRQKENQLQDTASKTDALNARIQELLEINKNLHLKNQEARTDVSKLMLEKSECKNELMLQKKENVLLSESIDELILSSSSLREDNKKLLSYDCEYEHAVFEDVNCSRKREANILNKIKKLQSELQRVRSKLNRCDENQFVTRSDESKAPTSRIHQLFHLFLGFTTISEFYCL